MYWHHGWGWGAWVGMALMMLVFWGVVAALVVVAIRSWGHQEPPPPSQPQQPPEDRAMQVLDERFARGEIDAQEYRSRRELLRSR